MQSSLPDFYLAADVLFSPAFLALFFLVIALSLYAFRARWTPYFQALPWHALPLPLVHRGAPATAAPGSDLREASSFLADYRAGLSSTTFDLGANLEAGDARAGLDAAARAQIQSLMQHSPGLSFDAARKLFFDRKLQENNIGPDGVPNDPKAIFFSR